MFVCNLLITCLVYRVLVSFKITQLLNKSCCWCCLIRWPPFDRLTAVCFLFAHFSTSLDHLFQHSFEVSTQRLRPAQVVTFLALSRLQQENIAFYMPCSWLSDTFEEGNIFPFFMQEHFSTGSKLPPCLL